MRATCDIMHNPGDRFWKKILGGFALACKNDLNLLFLQSLEDEKACEQFSVDTRYAPFLLLFKSSSALQRFLFIFAGSFILFNTARGQGSLRQFVGRKAPNQAIIAPITTTW